MSTTAGPPAGWYPDPQGALDTKRFWDGRTWTDSVAPVASQPSTAAPDHSNLIISGFVAAILLPVIGLVIGVVLLAKSAVGPGLGVLVASVISTIVWANVVVALIVM